MGTCYLHWFVVSFDSSPHPKTILLLGSIDLFNLYLRRVTVLILPTIAPLLYLPLSLKSLKLFLMLIFSNILNLTLFFLITSMVFVKRDQLVTFLTSLMYGHPLLGTLGNLTSLLLISLRLLTESGIGLCYPNFLLMALLLLSVNSLKA